MAELIQLGKWLGHAGQELRKWVTRQREIQRADRAAEREAEKTRPKPKGQGRKISSRGRGREGQSRGSG